MKELAIIVLVCTLYIGVNIADAHKCHVCSPSESCNAAKDTTSCELTGENAACFETIHIHRRNKGNTVERGCVTKKIKKDKCCFMSDGMRKCICKEDDCNSDNLTTLELMTKDGHRHHHKDMHDCLDLS